MQCERRRLRRNSTHGIRRGSADRRNPWLAGTMIRVHDSAVETIEIEVAYCHQYGALDRLGDAAEIVHGSNQCRGRYDSALIERVALVPSPAADFAPRARQLRR